MRIRSLLIVVGLAVLAAACADPGTTVQTTPPTTTADEQLDELAAARSQWESAAPADYTVRTSDQIVAVHDDEIVSLSSSGSQTVDEIFDTIEDSLRDGATVEVEYDTDLGYPVRVIIDLDGDGITDIDLEYTDLDAMPIVQTLDELLAAQAAWEALNKRDYTYIIRFACNCPLLGTYEVEVRDGSGLSARPLDEAAEAEPLYPVSIDSLMDDLVLFFSSPDQMVEDGIESLDVRMDPDLGYPRWLEIVGNIDDEGFPDEITLVATIDLVESIEPSEPTESDLDLERQHEAVRQWRAAELRDYDFDLTVHCGCPPETRGPFPIEVRQGQRVKGDGPVQTINHAFDLIDDAIREGIDVDVSYDPVLGYPVDVIIDPEAVAADGGMAFSISSFREAEEVGFIEGLVTAGPQCPVQQDPPDPACDDKPVVGTVIRFVQPGVGTVAKATTNWAGRYSIDLPPGTYVIEPMPFEGLLGTPSPVEVAIEAYVWIDVDFHYDTGIR